MQSDKTSTLLAHENLHWDIAKYLTGLARTKLATLQGSHQATRQGDDACNRAKQAAVALASAALRIQVKDLMLSLQAADAEAQVFYDNHTAHGANAVNQAEWPALLNVYIDPIAASHGLI